MKVHYLEIVTADVDAICTAYEAAHNVQFGKTKGNSPYTFSPFKLMRLLIMFFGCFDCDSSKISSHRTPEVAQLPWWFFVLSLASTNLGITIDANAVRIRA